MASSIFIVPRHVLGGVGYLAPSDRLNIAAIGAGGKGASDIANASVNGRENVVALCDVDFEGSAKRSVERFPKAKLYANFSSSFNRISYCFYPIFVSKNSNFTFGLCPPSITIHSNGNMFW